MTTIQNNNLLIQRLNTEQMPVNSISTGTISAEKQCKQTNQVNPPIHLLLLSALAPILSMPLLQFILKKAIKNDKDLGIEFKSVEKTLDHMWEENKLKEKDIKIYFAPEGSKDAEMLMKNYGGGVYDTEAKQIKVMMEKASTSLHEAGHVVNHNCTKIGKAYSKFLNKMPKFLNSPVTMAIYSVLILQLIGQSYNKPKPIENNQQKEKFSIQKFLHDNIGKITLLAFAPILIDEASASWRAFKAAKSAAPEILKPLRKNLLLAGSTYLITTGVTLISSLLNRKYVDQVKAQRSS